VRACQLLVARPIRARSTSRARFSAASMNATFRSLHLAARQYRGGKRATPDLTACRDCSRSRPSRRCEEQHYPTLIAATQSRGEQDRLARPLGHNDKEFSGEGAKAYPGSRVHESAVTEQSSLRPESAATTGYAPTKPTIEHVPELLASAQTLPERPSAEEVGTSLAALRPVLRESLPAACERGRSEQGARRTPDLVRPA
jgi:hypothetical protein